MDGGDRHDKLREGVKTHVRRRKKAEQERDTVLAAISYLGVLGVVFVLPVVLGAYLGLWLDERVEGYSIRWTLGLFFLGIVVGVMNVYFLLRDKG